MLLCNKANHCICWQNIPMRSLYLAVVCLCYFTAFGQPGGGGGLVIKTITDKNNRVIPSIDCLRIHTFYCNDTAGPSVKQYTKADESTYYRYAKQQGQMWYLPPYLQPNSMQVNVPNQIIQLAYHNDTCTVQFTDIPLTIGNGLPYVIDTLQLLPGNYIFKCNVHKVYGYQSTRIPDAFRETLYTIYVLQSRGFTQYTLPDLVKYNMAAYTRQGLQRIVYKKPDNITDTVFLPTKPLHYVNAENFVWSDTAVNILFYDDPEWEDNTLLYRFLPVFVRTSDDLQAWAKPDKDILLYKKVLQYFKEKKVYINGSLYSGRLKMFAYFHVRHAPGIGNYGGYGLLVLHIKNGKLIKQDEYPDVDLHTEHAVIRPT